MSNESLASWKTDTAIILLGELPLQTLDSATVLVEGYLSETGGWIPDDEADPTGPGVPASGETSPEAANTIKETELERVYNTTVSATIEIDLHIVQNLDPGLSDEDVLILIEETVENQINEQLGCTNLELVSLNTTTGTSKQGGNTTAEERVAANDEVNSGDKLIDPVAISLYFARARFVLDDLWNVTYIYNEPGQDIVAQVERYTDLAYTTIDPTSTVQHIVTIDAVNFQLASGVSKTITE